MTNGIRAEANDQVALRRVRIEAMIYQINMMFLLFNGLLTYPKVSLMFVSKDEVVNLVGSN